MLSMLGGPGALLIPEILRASIGCKMICLDARRDDSFASSISDSAHIAFIDSAYEISASKFPTFRILSTVKREI